MHLLVVPLLLYLHLVARAGSVDPGGAHWMGFAAEGPRSTLLSFLSGSFIGHRCIFTTVLSSGFTRSQRARIGISQRKHRPQHVRLLTLYLPLSNAALLPPRPARLPPSSRDRKPRLHHHQRLQQPLHSSTELGICLPLPGRRSSTPRLPVRSARFDSRAPTTEVVPSSEPPAAPGEPPAAEPGEQAASTPG